MLMPKAPLFYFSAIRGLCVMKHSDAAYSFCDIQSDLRECFLNQFSLFCQLKSCGFIKSESIFRQNECQNHYMAFGNKGKAFVSKGHVVISTFYLFKRLLINCTDLSGIITDHDRVIFIFF